MEGGGVFDEVGSRDWDLGRFLFGMGTEGVRVFKGVDLQDCELERDDLVGVYWDVIGGWEMGSLADI